MPLPTKHLDGRRRDMRVTELPGALEKRRRPLPFCLRVVLENVTRNATSDADHDLAGRIAAWEPGSPALIVPLRVDRVVLPDSSGLPVLLDFAALRDALAKAGGDPAAAEPQVPCQLVVDHSLIVDQAGHAGALLHNLAMEYRRNSERYSVFKWAQQAFSRLSVVPPGMGIIHQVHIERLAKVMVENDAGLVHPEFVLGCDSHTPMVNALGVLGWGVGGIDAEAALVGERYRVTIPRVVGVRLTGALRVGVTTTDLVLTLTERLRKLGVVGDFVEFTGAGLDTLTVPDRATLCNMAPEYGATCGYFPIDAMTLRYLTETGREAEHVALVEQAARALGLYREPDALVPEYSAVLDLDLSGIEPSLAGPRRPQDRVSLHKVREAFGGALAKPKQEGGFGAAPHPDHGRLAIAAITSCTNTSNPAIMLGAGLVARNATAKGLQSAPHVKTSLAPGSRVAVSYLERAGLMEPLERLGFHVVGFGCTTCSGKSGPIDPAVERAAAEGGMIAAAILSGNRNFDGRIHKSVQAAFLGSPLLVVAFAIAGRIDVDLTTEPLGTGSDGRPVFLRDIWPDADELAALVHQAAQPADYRANYAHIHEGTEEWKALESRTGALFSWDEGSTYIRRPPFFDADFLAERRAWDDEVKGARTLALFGDSLTTDHITPSGEITRDTLAGQYLTASGVSASALNAYTQRRGNHEVLMRATFANPRIRNRLLPDGREGGRSEEHTSELQSH